MPTITPKSDPIAEVLAQVTPEPIKGTPVVGLKPNNISFKNVGITVDAEILDISGQLIGFASAVVSLSDPDILKAVTPDELTTLFTVAKLVWRLNNRIN